MQNIEWIKSSGSYLQRSVNVWFTDPGHNDRKTIEIRANRTKLDFLPQLSSCLLVFSNLDSYVRLNAEFRLFDKTYVQSRFQIRSFPYLRTLKKMRKMVKRLLALNIPEICSEIATTKLTRTHLLSKQSFESLQWRCVAAILLAQEITTDAGHLVELLTQELHPSVFTHFPIVFISLSASIVSIVGEWSNELFLLFRRLRTFSMKEYIAFPDDPDMKFPELPTDASLEANLAEIGVVAIQAPKKPVVEKIDFKLSGRPQTQLRGRPVGIAQKPKSALDSLGF